MHKFAALLMAVAFTAPALAQDAPAKIAYSCWYKASGKFVNATPTEGPKLPSTFTSTGRGGDKAFVYGILSVDGKDCPTRVRN